jgi:hypothetical protein
MAKKKVVHAIFNLTISLICMIIVSWIWEWEFMHSIKICTSTVFTVFGVVYLMVFCKDMLE